jgi:hypothetical protein
MFDVAGAGESRDRVGLVEVRFAEIVDECVELSDFAMLLSWRSE